LYNILIVFGVPITPVRHIKMCSNETYSKVHIGKHLSDNVPTKNGLKQGYALSSLLFNFALHMPLGGSRKTRWDLNGTHQLLIYADDVNLLGDNRYNKEKH
jgi:hypothetical protein